MSKKSRKGSKRTERDSAPPPPAPPAATRQVPEQTPSVSQTTVLNDLAQASFDAFARGDFQTALAVADQLLKATPGNPIGLYVQGLIADATGSSEKAELIIEGLADQGLKLPRLAFNLGVVKLRLQKYDEAEALFEEAVKVEPNYLGLWSNLGVVRKRLGKFPEALEALNKAVALDPNNSGVWNNLGSLALEMADMLKAEEAFKKSLELQPDQVEALDNLSRIMETPERRKEALPYLQRLERLVPDRMMVQARLGASLLANGQNQEAAERFQKARAIAKGKAIELNRLGLYHRSIGHIKEAMVVLADALEADPDCVEANNSLAAMFHENGRMDLALPYYQKALNHDEKNVHVLNNLGNFFKSLGRAEDAFDHYRRAVAVKPNFDAAWRNLLGASLYHSPLSEDERFQLRKDFVAACAPTANLDLVTFSNKPDPDRKLRVGVISGDLRDHPITRNMGPFFRGRDKGDMEVICYGPARRADSMTQQVKGWVDGFRSMDNLSDAQLAALIAEDKIDVLFSIAGYFDENRPLVACYKPAPVIISYHDGSTSAVPGVDYIISDRHLTPPGGQEHFSERVIRIPSFYMHGPMEGMPDIGPCPSLSNRYVTFGSTNNPAKIGDAVLEAWGQLLARMPQSRLLLKYRMAFKEPMLRDRILGVMAGHGVGAHRILFWDQDLTHTSHLNLYNQIDVALDPFPFGGSTTTFEALWMGVPVVTMAGTNMMGRMPMSILKTVGLDELIADDLRGYFDLVEALSADIDRRTELRRTLRSRVAASPICDAESKARYLQRLIRAVWRRWCAAHPST